MESSILHLGPAELAILQSLGDQNHSGAIPEHQLDAIGALGAEDINSPGERIGSHGVAHEGGQSVSPFAEVDGLGGHENTDSTSRSDHRRLLRVCSTRA